MKDPLESRHEYIALFMWILMSFIRNTILWTSRKLIQGYTRYFLRKIITLRRRHSVMELLVNQHAWHCSKLLFVVYFMPFMFKVALFLVQFFVTFWVNKYSESNLGVCDSNSITKVDTGVDDDHLMAPTIVRSRKNKNAKVSQILMRFDGSYRKMFETML